LNFRAALTECRGGQSEAGGQGGSRGGTSPIHDVPPRKQREFNPISSISHARHHRRWHGSRCSRLLSPRGLCQRGHLGARSPTPIWEWAKERGTG
jgi:hypothetical protein